MFYKVFSEESGGQLTLQVVVLGGAVLFIFFGVSVGGCALLVPAAAAVVHSAVRLAHYAAAEKLEQVVVTDM